MEKALFGAGCFWGVEEFFRKNDGVIETKVGYSGGITNNPTYEQVCLGNTNHAEVLLIKFDENLINYSKLLDLFWQCHDPTTLNRQGPDIGTQYRSVIFYYSNLQKEIAEKSKLNYQSKFNGKIVTEIEKAKEFYEAEDYHQCYIQKRSI
ncbi:MAG: peptide-methionine (S)-S-oxide reductase [Rickettsiales bacterium]|nr:peptide-methionine (S)-S-oxide reductase [Rickettsiales bacterium]|tara:strand:+ start:1592 stop:2041 length:450 start_codon:yes stop_codon:yes gene_type:complete